jgi:hypothetical protein
MIEDGNSVRYIKLTQIYQYLVESAVYFLLHSGGVGTFHHSPRRQDSQCFYA